MAEAHTKGPWHINPIPQMGAYNIEREDGVIIGRMVHEADALNAAAAPELLEALRVAHAAMAHYFPCNAHANGARMAVADAIAKAEEAAV